MERNFRATLAHFGLFLISSGALAATHIRPSSVYLPFPCPALPAFRSTTRDLRSFEIQFDLNRPLPFISIRKCACILLVVVKWHADPCRQFAMLYPCYNPPNRPSNVCTKLPSLNLLRFIVIGGCVFIRTVLCYA